MMETTPMTSTSTATDARPCFDCQRPCMANRKWRRNKAANQAAGILKSAQSGLCVNCRNKQTRPTGKSALRWRAGELLEEASFLLDSCRSRQELAERLRLRLDTFDQALTRARNAGDARGARLLTLPRT